MLDQANHLRQLMRGTRRDSAANVAQRPRLLVVAGSKGGVGTTTVAVNVAVALVLRGRKTLVVDGDLGKADVASLCGARQAHTVGDVLAGRRSVQEAIENGPAGIRILPGAWATGHVTDCDAAAQERLIADLAQLRPFDYAVIDAGCGVNRIVQRFWRAADRVLLVATADDASVLDAYAALKTAGARREAPAVQVMMNMADEGPARESLSRLREACRRFLGWELDCVASLPACREIPAAARRQVPVVLASPGSQAARLIKQLAETIAETTPEPGDEIQQSIQGVHA